MPQRLPDIHLEDGQTVYVYGKNPVKVFYDKKINPGRARVLAAGAYVEPPVDPPPVDPPPVVTPPTGVTPYPGLATGGSLQAAINSSSAGATIGIPPRTYAEIVTVNKALTLTGTAPGVILDGTGKGIGNQVGLLKVTANDVTLRAIRVIKSGGAGLRFETVARLLVEDCEFDQNGQQGYTGSTGTDITFRRMHSHHNNVGQVNADGSVTVGAVDPLWEAGGGKVHGTRITFDSCEVDHNGGPGIWFDQWYPTPYPANRDFNPGAVIINCKTHHNTHAGIFYEVSDGAANQPAGTLAQIKGNKVWENGWRDTRGWGWPAGILVSSSRNAHVADNVVAWNGVGIAFVSQNRGDRPGDPTGLDGTNNVIAGKAPIAAYVDWTPPTKSIVTSPNTIVNAGDTRLVGVPATPESGHGG